MPESFLFSYSSFDSNNQPFLDMEVGSEIERLPILGQNLALEFDFSTKYCTGWVDFENRCSVPCPDHATVDVKYENCVKCRNRTGFNPAFYHTDTVSKQQEKINQQPHYVYLAYFAPDTIKVGISQESRGLRRILEQGARLATKLEVFNSALIARQYEEKISSQAGIVETVLQRKKMELLRDPFDEELARKQLLEIQQQIESKLAVEFNGAEIIETAQYYSRQPVDPSTAIQLDQPKQMVGEVVAVIGKTLVTKHQSNLLAYNLRQFLGYKATKIRGEIDIDLPSEQLTLF